MRGAKKIADLFCGAGTFTFPLATVAPVLAADASAVIGFRPRAGALDQTRQLAGTKAQTVVYVSCNPVTFARDARVLIEAGFRLERVMPVDQFLWSAHVELVGVFRR